MSPDPSSPVPTPRPISPAKLRLAALAFVVVAVLIVASGIAIRTSNAARLSERASDVSVPTVSVVAPGTANGSGTLELPGRIEAYSRAPIYARVSGYVKSWKVDIGSPVKAGQLLAEIDSPDLDQQLIQARADLATAKANATLAGTTAKRWQSLLAGDSVSRQEAEEKANDFATKQSAVNASQANVDRFLATKTFTRIVAPFDGTVTSRSTDVGALVNAGSGTGPELFTVSDTKRLRVYVNVPQNYVVTIRRGNRATVAVPERRGKTYAATIESTSGAVNVASGTMLVQLAVDNANGELLPGSFANVSIALPRDADTLVVPPSALLFDKSGLRVATVDANDHVVLKPVTIARDLGRVVEIASGLSANDRVIESPPDSISNGDAVRVAKSDPKDAAKAAAK